MADTQLELELTFLAKFLPKEIKNAQPIVMKDIYVPQSAPHPNLRLRRRGNKYEITKKQPVNQGDVSVQTEQTLSLEPAEFEALSGASAKTVDKNRYIVSIGGKQAEVDVFTGKLAGLVVIDFEFESEAEKAAFKAPDCCLAEVTQEQFIAGGLLAGKSYSDIAPNLETFGYKPIKA